MSRLRLLTVAILAALGMASAGPKDNSLVVVAAHEPPLLGDFWGFTGSGAVASEIENYLWAGLEYVNLDGENEPYLITETPTLANGRLRVSDAGHGEKRLDIHYTLRRNVYWSDGAPITSDDVAFYYEVGKHPGAPVPNPSYWKRLRLSVEDERNFTVTLEPAYAYDLVGPVIGLAPAHVMRANWEITKKQTCCLDPEMDADELADLFRGFVLRFGSLAAQNRGSLVYSGPFKLKRWRAGTLELTRNPRFFIRPPGGDRHYVQKVIYRFIDDPDALTAALRGGGVDATSSLALDLEQARSPQLTQWSRGRFDIWAVPGPVWEHLEVNKFSSVTSVRDLRLNDPRTRRALLYAINRRGLVKAFFDDLLPVADSWLSPQNPRFDPGLPHYPYDPAKAKALLAQLGWRDLDGDGYLERKTGDGRLVRFELEYVTTAGDRNRERVQKFIADDLEKVGIRVVIKNAPTGKLFSKGFLNRAYDGRWRGLLEFAWLIGLADDASLFACSGADDSGYLPTPDDDYSGYNFGWCNREFDRLRAAALREFDPEKQREYWRLMQRIWASELPSLPLYWRANPLLVRKGLLNYVTSTYFGGFGYPTTTAWLIGWAENGAQQVFDQSRYARDVLRRR